MKLSLSLLLPVRNVQTTLQSTIHPLLDVLPELTHEFEVLIVDDGSTDATCEVAYEFALDYPQVRVARNAIALGWATAVTRQAMSAAGEFLMIHTGGAFEPDDVVGLWRLRHSVAAAAKAKSQVSQANKSWRIDLQNVKAASSGNARSPQDASLLGIHARAPRSNLLLVHRTAWSIEALAGRDSAGWLACRRSKRHPSKKISNQAAKLFGSSARVRTGRINASARGRFPNRPANPRRLWHTRRDARAAASPLIASHLSFCSLHCTRAANSSLVFFTTTCHTNNI